MDARRRKKMRKLVLTATLALSVVFSFGQSTALAASSTSQTVDVTGYANFSSILGGNISGPVALSGSLSDGQLGTLHGSANFPLPRSQAAGGFSMNGPAPTIH